MSILLNKIITTNPSFSFFNSYYSFAVPVQVQIAHPFVTFERKLEAPRETKGKRKIGKELMQCKQPDKWWYPRCKCGIFSERSRKYCAGSTCISLPVCPACEGAHLVAFCM